MSFRVLDDAQDDAVSAARWYEGRQTGLGAEFLDAVERVLNQIEQSPGSFPAWEQYGGPGDVRRCLLARFPYVVLYQYSPKETVVVAIGHARRHPRNWIQRLKAD
jgi:plasmid stabilization system protein ParE